MADRGEDSQGCGTRAVAPEGSIFASSRFRPMLVHDFPCSRALNIPMANVLVMMVFPRAELSIGTRRSRRRLREGSNGIVVGIWTDARPRVPPLLALLFSASHLSFTAVFGYSFLDVPHCITISGRGAYRRLWPPPFLPVPPLQWPLGAGPYRPFQTTKTTVTVTETR
jgi:hypothetical protein